MVAALTGLGAVLLRRRLALRAGRSSLDEAIPAVALLVFGLVFYFPPFQYVLGGKDPGVYVNAGFHLARHGNLAFEDPLVKDVPASARGLFFRDDDPLPAWSQPRYLGYYLESVETGRVVSQGFHLYPVWIGVAASLFEMKAGLYATPFFALMGVLGTYFAARRLFDGEVAIWAGTLLAVFQIQVWFARFPNTEVVVQFLYATGLFTFFWMRENRSPLAGALSGFAFASTLLVRLDSILFLVPLSLYFAALRVTRKLERAEAAFLASFAAVGLHAAVHAATLSRPYVDSVFGRWYWRALGENLPVVGVTAIVLFIAVDRWAAKPASRLVALLSDARVRVALALIVFGLACYAYFVRPFWHYYRTAPHDAESFFRMSWYLYPMGVALAVAGIMLLLLRGDRRSSIFLLVALTFALFYFYKVRVSNDHFFLMRRFIPVILPAAFVAIGVFLGSLRPWAKAPLGALLLFVYAKDAWPLFKHDEFKGSLDFVSELGRLVGDRDVVIFPRKEGLHLLELPLAELESKNVLEFYTLKPDPETLGELLRAWRGRYGDLFFVTNYKISLSGFFTRWVRDFELATQKYEYTYTRPPVRAEPFHLRFTLSKAVDLEDLRARVPKIGKVDVGGSDDPLVAWFHEKELDGDVSYRWSQGTSSIFLPALGPASRVLVLSLAGPEARPGPPARVRLLLGETLLADLELTPRFDLHTVELPPSVRAWLEHAYPVLRLETETWRPENTIPGSRDIRDLGVRVDWVDVR